MQWAYHMILPWATFMILFAALYVRMIRANVIETLNEDYVRTARAKGAPESRRDALARAPERDAADRDDARDGHRPRARRRRSSPRRVYSLPGLGRTAVQALFNYDLPTVQGVIVFATIVIIVLQPASSTSSTPGSIPGSGWHEFLPDTPWPSSTSTI